jgi:hypothetical protein
MQRKSSAEDVLIAVRRLARPDDRGEKSVDVSVVSSFTGLSNTEIADLVAKLEKFEAPIRLLDQGRTIRID